MSREKQIMSTTVELVSAYMQGINVEAMRTSKDYANAYAEFIETVYRKVEELTPTE